MKIAHIAPPWISIPPQNYGGTEIVLYNLIEEQVAQGHDVTLFAPGDAQTSAKLVSFFPQSLIDAGIPWQGHLKAFYHVQKSIDYINSHDFDIVHMHLSSSSDMYVFPLTRGMKTPRVVTLHSRFPFDRVADWTGDADASFMEWMKDVPMVAISECARDEVPYPLNFVGVVHHGLSMERFQPTVAQPDDSFAWLGRFVPEKGAHLAIEAAQRANVRLVLAGTVDRHVPHAVKYFEEQIKPRIDGQQITYIGPVNHEQKVDLFSHARAFLNPIEWEEPFGMVMIEAMATGCPVIAFTRGAAPEIVMHRKGGFLVHDVREMVHFMGKIGELDRSQVREHVAQNFSVQSMAHKYVKIYRRIIAETRNISTIAKPTVTRLRPAPVTSSTFNKAETPLVFPRPAALTSVNSLDLESTL